MENIAQIFLINNSKRKKNKEPKCQEDGYLSWDLQFPTINQLLPSYIF